MVNPLYELSVNQVRSQFMRDAQDELERERARDRATFASGNPDPLMRQAMAQGANVATPLPRPVMPQNPMPVPYQDMGHVTPFNAPPREVNITGPMQRPALGPVAAQSLGILSSNRRDMAPMAIERPSAQIGTNEMLIRMGLAGVRGAAKGGLESLGAMGDVYGQVQDANRTAAIAAYEDEVQRATDERDAEALRKYRESLVEAKKKSGTKPDAKQDRKDQDQIATIDESILEMNRALSMIKEGGVTGWWDATVGMFFDKATGGKDEIARKLLNKLKVDDALLRIAQTKGAISNKEMDLFLSPAPDVYDQENVWESWIGERIKALQRVKSRLANNQTVEDVATSQQIDSFSTNQIGSEGSSEISDDDLKAKYGIN